MLLVVGEGDENTLSLDPLSSEVEELAVCGPVASAMDYAPKVTRYLPQNWRWCGEACEWVHSVPAPRSVPRSCRVRSVPGGVIGQILCL